MSMRLKALFLAGLLAPALAPGLAVAQNEKEFTEEELERLLHVKIRTVQHMALNPVLIRAVRAQNAEGLTLETIKSRDEEWSGTDALTHFKRQLQQNEAGTLLKRLVATNKALNEAFLTDNKGANVAAFPATSDYWQGDEEKWSNSFNEGHGKIFVGPVEFDDSTKTYAVQISAPLIHQGETIGVLVVGVTLDYLDTKRQT